MVNKKVPMRQCVGCNEMKSKKELIRVVRDNLGNVSVDLTGKKNGRGAYLKKDVDAIKKAKDSKILERYLEVLVPDVIYEELISIIEK